MTLVNRCASLLAPPFLAAALAATLAACSPPAPPPAEAGPTVSGTTVRFHGRPEGIRLEAVQDAGSTTLTLPGRLAWDEDVTVRVFTPFSGRLTKPLAQVGDRVTAGQPLAEMASAEFGETTAAARRAEADARLASQTLARLRDLHASGLVPRKDLLEAQALADRAAIERERTRTRLAQVGATGKASDFILRSPIDGVVVERAVNPGQEVRADQAGTPLFVITDPMRLWAWLDAPESALPRLAGAEIGDPVRISSGAWPGRTFGARLLRKEDAIDPTARTFRLRAAVDNPERALKAEMFVNASLALPDDAGGKPIENIPAAAVLLIDGQHQVFVQDGDTGFTRVPVQVVRELPGRVGVTGLPQGTSVVVEGNLFLQQILGRAGSTRTAQSTAR